MEETNLTTGLTTAQVQAQKQAGQLNQTPNNSTPVTMIISKNLCTLFNLINLVLAVLIFTTGSYANLLFLGPVVANFLIGTYQEVKAKKELDQMTFLNRQQVTTRRNRQEVPIFQDELVRGDLVYLKRGDQVPADALVRQTQQIEVDESNLTGESRAIAKQVGEQLLSGSIITGGQAWLQLTAVGSESFANQLAANARDQKHEVSQLLQIINRIIQLVTYTIIPLGLILFLTVYGRHHQLNSAILGTSASMLGMIPQGLVLLTSVALAVGTMHLSKHQVLVKSMTALESLARVDTLCLDKTGTITTGDLRLHEVISTAAISSDQLLIRAQKIMLATQEQNETAQAILKNCSFQLDLQQILSVVPFSSERKWLAANFVDQNYWALGAPTFLLTDPQELAQAQQYAQQGFRVLALVQASQEIQSHLTSGQLQGFLLINDEVRPTAQNTFSYLRTQGITLKVISGDDPQTVSKVAQQVKLPQAEQYVDMSEIGATTDFNDLVEKYTIFGRTLPNQKQELITALQNQKHKVAMTGDGVNDVLAMRQSDCGIAIAGNSDAAESAADFVLLNQDFDSLIEVLKEGRRVINNIERVAALYLIKTMYSAALTIFFILIHTSYPFYPAQMTPVNAITVGIPTLFLALQPDFRPPEGRFFRNVLQVALPAALEITALVMGIIACGRGFNWSFSQTSTLSVWVISLVSFAALWTTSRPWNRANVSLFLGLFLLNLTIFSWWGRFFKISAIFSPQLREPILILLLAFYPIFLIVRELIVRYVLRVKR
ncbi:HAD-IC family P-type ATPase [Lactobacillus sp. DCY120]|uniref:HAD-IC family P-type ATPase n=1 Tax=Bombilactobacillus apium TaxID=2675299 RepID=A0A850RAS7_9LACO|nr:HAD-IC family P-type ATPase [Bombilactobacillus apium]NVY96436.1 HAD-IC family P-type ATPase [Bombilactobacillus apium]